MHRSLLTFIYAGLAVQCDCPIIYVNQVTINSFFLGLGNQPDSSDYNAKGTLQSCAMNTFVQVQSVETTK